MKLLHLSDLHLGKRVNEFPMLEDQDYILKEILQMVEDHHSDGVIIAGDVYDKAVPSAEAVQLFDDFLYRLVEKNQQIFVISGNHDSPERIAFASRMLGKSGVHMSPVYHGEVPAITLQDDYGPVNFFLLPFVKPAHVRRYYPEESIESYTDAISTVISHMELPERERNILVTHQFVGNAIRSDSEEVSVGGTDQVEVSVMEPFDYVALGHIHRPQYVGGKTIRYCGTPLKYSFSEADHEKSVTLVELREKGQLTIQELPLHPRHDMRELKGTYMELTAKASYRGTAVDDYLHITLTDEEEVPDAIAKLRIIYPNIMKLDYDNRRTRWEGSLELEKTPEHRSPLELFADFYRQQNGQDMTGEQKDWVEGWIEKIWEGEL
jgi:exonuclease SbcD